MGFFTPPPPTPNGLTEHERIRHFFCNLERETGSLNLDKENVLSLLIVESSRDAEYKQEVIIKAIFYLLNIESSITVSCVYSFSSVDLQL